MKLAKLKICNYRSFGDEQEIPIDKMTKRTIVTNF